MTLMTVMKVFNCAIITFSLVPYYAHKIEVARAPVLMPQVNTESRINKDLLQFVMSSGNDVIYAIRSSKIRLVLGTLSDNNNNNNTKRGVVTFKLKCSSTTSGLILPPPSSHF